MCNNCGCNADPFAFNAEKKNCGCGQDPCVTYGAETFAARGTYNLYKSQEKVLKAYRDSGGKENHYDSLPPKIVNKLESIRNSETLWSDVNRWLWDNPSTSKNPYGGFHSSWDAESFGAEAHTDRIARLRREMEQAQDELERIEYCNHQEWNSINGWVDENPFSLTIECPQCGSHGVASWDEPTAISWDRTHLAEEYFNASMDIKDLKKGQEIKINGLMDDFGKGQEIRPDVKLRHHREWDGEEYYPEYHEGIVSIPIANDGSVSTESKTRLYYAVKYWMRPDLGDKTFGHFLQVKDRPMDDSIKTGGQGAPMKSRAADLRWDKDQERFFIDEIDDVILESGYISARKNDPKDLQASAYAERGIYSISPLKQMGAESLMAINQNTPISNFTTNELTHSSTVQGDFNQASINSSGHQNFEVRGAEPELVGGPCEICGEDLFRDSDDSMGDVCLSCYYEERSKQDDEGNEYNGWLLNFAESFGAESKMCSYCKTTDLKNFSQGWDDYCMACARRHLKDYYAESFVLKTDSGHEVEWDDGSFYMTFKEPIDGYGVVSGDWYGGEKESPDEISLDVEPAWDEENDDDYDVPSLYIQFDNVEYYGIKNHNMTVSDDIVVSPELSGAIQEGLAQMVADHADKTVVSREYKGESFGAETITTTKIDNKGSEWTLQYRQPPIGEQPTEIVATTPTWSHEKKDFSNVFTIYLKRVPDSTSIMPSRQSPTGYWWIASRPAWGEKNIRFTNYDSLWNWIGSDEIYDFPYFAESFGAEEMNTVRCNKCMWEGEEEDLVMFEDEDGFGKGCPKCETDAYLMDVDLDGKSQTSSNWVIIGDIIEITNDMEAVGKKIPLLGRRYEVKEINPSSPGSFPALKATPLHYEYTDKKGKFFPTHPLYKPQADGSTWESSGITHWGRTRKIPPNSYKIVESFGAEYGKRQRFGNRYVGRDTKGKFISNVSVGRSLKADRRTKSKTPARSGFGHKGDTQKGASAGFKLPTDAKSVIGMGAVLGGLLAYLESKA